ncbi:MAG: hypothetical protein LBU47_08465, partial [Christensenellaceae bacterium]|nr:hypothetical protein [Christensenellaceae bacterium]
MGGFHVHGAAPFFVIAIAASLASLAMTRPSRLRFSKDDAATLSAHRALLRHCEWQRSNPAYFLFDEEGFLQVFERTCWIASSLT